MYVLSSFLFRAADENAGRYATAPLRYRLNIEHAARRLVTRA